MTKSIRSKLASLLGVALVATSLAVAASTGTAAADEVSGFAQGLPGLSVAGGAPLGVAGCTGTGTPAEASNTCAVNPVLPTHPLVDLGVAAQDVATDRFGHVASCAGLIGEGGSIEVGDDFECALNDAPGGNQGLQVLDVLGGAVLGLDAAYAECFSSATANIGASATIRNLTVLGQNIATLDSPPNTVLDVLGLATIKLNTQTPIPNGIRVTALEVEVLGVLGAPLLDLEVGTVECQVDGISNDRTSGVFDTAGDVVDEPGPTLTAGQTVQPNTRNALAVTFASGGDRLDARGIIRLGPGVEVDTQRGSVGGRFQTTVPNAGLPSNCVATQNVAEPLDPRIVCDLGEMTGGIPETVTIPVTLGDVPANGFFEATAQLEARTTNPVSNILTGQGPVAQGGRGPLFGGPALTSAEQQDLDGPRYGLIQVAPEVQENTFEVQEGTTLTIADLDDDLDLPENVGGKLYLDLPDFVESVRYGDFACDIVDENPVPADEVVPTAYPFLPDAGHTKWDCGQAIKPVDQPHQLELDIEAGTPQDLVGQLGRAVIIRRTNPPTFAPPAVQENSFYSDLIIQVFDGPVEPGQDAVAVDLTVAPASLPAPGGEFDYTATITNVGDNAGQITTLERRSRQNNGAFGPWTEVGDPDCQVGTALAVTASCLYTFSDELLGDSGDTETFEVRARIGASPLDSDAATAVIGNAHHLSVVKRAIDDDLPEPGGQFTYEVTVTNVDDQFDGDITIDSVTDVIAGRPDRDLGDNDGCTVGTVLAEGASCTFTFVDTFVGDAGDDLTDTVVVTGTAADGFPAEGRGSETVSIVPAGGGGELDGLVVDLSADPNSIPEPGGEAEFTLRVTNTLPANGADLRVTDLKIQYNPTVDAEDMDDSDCEVGAVLDPGETYTCHFTDEVEGNAGDLFTYTAHARAEDAADNEYLAVPDAATIELTDVLPRIRVDETVEPASRKTPGGNFTWTVTVTNESKASSDPVQITSLRNELLLDLEQEPDCEDEVLGAILDVGESVSCTFTTKVEGPDGKVATDIVVVTAEDDEGNVVSDLGNAAASLTAADEVAPPTTTKPTVRENLVKTGANSGTVAAAAMLFAGLGLVLTGGGMQQAPELALEGQRRRRRR